MSDEPGDHNALLRAIGTMRAELDVVIGEEIDRLRVERLEPRRSSGPPGVIDVEVEGPRPQVSESERDVRESPSWDGPRFQADDRGLAHPRPAGGVEVEGEDSGEAERRLDALALRLEGRLRRSRDRETHRYHPVAEEGPDPGREGNGEMLR